MPTVKKCIICGYSFNPVTNHQKYCCVSCSMSAQNKKRRHVRTCEVCNKEFKAPSKKYRFCSRSCSNKRRKGTKYNGKGVSEQTRVLEDRFLYKCF